MAPAKKVNKEESEGVGRITWSKEAFDIFCDLCIKVVQRSKGPRGSVVSQRMPWKNLEVEFQKQTKLPYDKNKLKNKWDWMKSRWSLWKALKGKDTGLGWDHEKGTISASDEWWEKKIQENHHFKVFQEEGLEPDLESKLEQLFRVSLAHGGAVHCPVMNLDSPDVTQGEDVYIPSMVEDHLNDGDMQSWHNGGETSDFNTDCTSRQWEDVWTEGTPNPSPTSYATQNEGGRNGKRPLEEDAETLGNNKSGSRKVGGAALLIEKLDAMAQAVVNKANTQMMNAKAPTHSVTDSLAKIMCLPDLEPSSPEFFFACEMIEDAQKRTIFHGLADDKARLGYIRYLYAKSL